MSGEEEFLIFISSKTFFRKSRYFREQNVLQVMTGSGSRLVPDGAPDTSNHENHENTHYHHSLRCRTGRRGWPQFPVSSIYENQLQPASNADLLRRSAG